MKVNGIIGKNIGDHYDCYITISTQVKEVKGRHYTSNIGRVYIYNESVEILKPYERFTVETDGEYLYFNPVNKGSNTPGSSKLTIKNTTTCGDMGYLVFSAASQSDILKDFEGLYKGIWTDTYEDGTKVLNVKLSEKIAIDKTGKDRLELAENEVFEKLEHDIVAGRTTDALNSLSQLRAYFKSH